MNFQVKEATVSEAFTTYGIGPDKYADELQALRDERDRLARALEQVSVHLAQPGDDETPANQYVPTAVEILACQSIIEAALTPAGGGRK